MMIAWHRWTPQPLLAVLLALLALGALIAVWTVSPVSASPQLVLVVLGLSAAAVVADHWPIHIHYSTKVTITNVPIYLMAVLLPPAVAVLAIGGSRLIADLLTSRQRGSLPSDIVTSTSRWIIVGLVGTTIAHLPASHALLQLALLCGTALAMFLADLLTAPLEIAPMTGDPPFLLVRALAREGTPVEVAQYVLAIIGALSGLQNVFGLALLALPSTLVYRAFKHAKETRDSTRQMLEQMADAVDLRDPYTGGHSRRVTDLCRQILQILQFEGPDAELIILAARVHDIGKIGVPDGILNKPGLLTPEEREQMEAHAARGAEFLARYPDFSRGTAIVRHHHERWDGRGYPDRIASVDIPLGARVIAVADSFDAMTSDRPYRKGMSVERALAILREGSGSQWDPRIVDAFLRLHDSEKVAAVPAIARQPIAEERLVQAM